MFLFYRRGYWQELIESIVWAHGQLNCTPNIYPRALSITQGRAVGMVHYLLGGIVTTWSFFLARAAGTEIGWFLGRIPLWSPPDQRFWPSDMNFRLFGAHSGK